MVELQPEVNAFAITARHGVKNSHRYAVSTFGHRRSPNGYVRNNKLGVHTSIFGQGRNPSEAESTTGLREDAIAQDNDITINQTVSYQTEYSMSSSPNGLHSPPFLT